MKNNKAITLSTLTIYIVAMITLLLLIGKMTSNLYIKTKNIDSKTIDVSSLNTFNAYFTKEVKISGNDVYNTTDDTIIFTSGNIFSLKKDKKIYYNTVQICSNVESVKFEYDSVKKIIQVKLKFGNLNEQTLNYKIEDIY